MRASVVPQAPRPRLRFGRRVLAMMLAAGIIPSLAWGLAAGIALRSMFTVSLTPLESLLERADAELQQQRRDPILTQDLAQARLYLAQAELARRSLVRQLPFAFLLLVLTSAAVSALAAVVIGRRLSRPIEQLTEAAMRYAQGDLLYRIPDRPERRPDELQYLIHQFNQMGTELENQRERLRVTEKLAAWQGIARTLAHELRNPLTAMKMALGRVARLSDRADPEDARRLEESAALLGEEIDVLLRMTEAFSAFARLPPPTPKRFQLRELLEEVCSLYRNQSSVPVECSAPSGVEVEADPDQLRRALGNLVKNAIEASERGKEPVRVELSADERRVRISITDKGEGIPAPLEGAAFSQGLVSSKPGGSGLGLTICHKIVHEHGGTLRVEARPEGGTQAIIELPQPARGDQTSSSSEGGRGELSS